MFKCVIRSWNSLISNVCILRISCMPFPDSGFFCKFSPDEPRMEYVSYSDEVITDNNVNSNAFVESYFSLLPSKYSPYHLVDCCNGIILLVSVSVCHYYLCNPAIKQCVAIPKVHAHSTLYFVEPHVVYGLGWINHSVYLDGMLYNLTKSKHLLVFDLKSLTARAIELPDKDEIDANDSLGFQKAFCIMPIMTGPV
ncbi:hypothetical protein JRO89_XS13G0224600 [Xanthoceras sorbifolium]|uniref:F-box protein n=1 Tax=Xanthoceras sorbifolium TaxID=99658 RepID=A0ABQ8H9I9_9ROSI|nr:hypothetical protein JRO89_XS13G0224600 [Xanthoceras sorbifolium]